MRSVNGLCRRTGDADNAAPPAPAFSRPGPATGDRIAHRYACRPERGARTESALASRSALARRTRRTTIQSQRTSNIGPRTNPTKNHNPHWFRGHLPQTIDPSTENAVDNANANDCTPGDISVWRVSALR